MTRAKETAAIIMSEFASKPPKIEVRFCMGISAAPERLFRLNYELQCDFGAGYRVATKDRLESN